MAASVSKGYADTFEKLFSHECFGEVTQDRKVEEDPRRIEDLWVTSKSSKERQIYPGAVGIVAGYSR